MYASSRILLRKFAFPRNIIATLQPYSSEYPKLPECSFTPPSYTGITYQDALAVRSSNVTPCYKLYYSEPVMITNGYMQYLWDNQGKRYLDMFGGIVTVSVGHCHPKVTKAAIDQLNKLWHVTNIYMHPTLHEYTKKLTDKMPGDLKVCFFCNSGSEANDIAMTLARLYTGSFDIISLRNSYHGDSPYSVGLCGIGTWKHNLANGFGIHHVMNPEPYRGLWGGANCRDSAVQVDRKCQCSPDHCEAAGHYIQQLEETLNTSVTRNVAGFIVESIQGVGGTAQFTKGYVKKAFELIRDRGGLCISDEVQTGFGRTGKFWGFQNHDVVPDIVTLAKGMGNGFPLAAVVTRKEIMDSLKAALTFNTFGGNPVACAVGSAVLDVIDEEKLMENSEAVGSYLLQGLSQLRDTFDVVGDVRGKGLMIGVELVESKESKTPLGKPDMDAIFEDTKNMGLLVGKGGMHMNVLRIKPPMCVTNEDADFCVSVLKRAFSNHHGKKS